MKKSSKGFFFVLISFILMLYIFLYLTAWVNALEISEKAASEKFRAANLESIVSQLELKHFEKFFSTSGHYALFRINNHSMDIAHPMKYNSSNDLQYLNSAFFSAMVFGNTSGVFDNTDINYSAQEAGTYTFTAWLNNLNSTLAQAGLVVKNFSIVPGNFTQIDPVTFSASINISILVQDKIPTPTLSIRRDFKITKNFSVVGLTDPMIYREYSKISASTKVERQIFYKNTTLASLAPIEIINGTQGQGFFYGPLINTSDAAAIPPQLQSDYILVGSFSDILSTVNYTKYGAYVITSAVGTSASGCTYPIESGTFNEIDYAAGCALTLNHQTNKPFFVILNFNTGAFSGPQGGHHALLVSNHTVSEVQSDIGFKLQGASAYEIEALRDDTICTYFIHTERGPSYAQRLSFNALSLNSTQFGLETFLVGKWAGGTSLPSYDSYSRSDVEFFKKVAGVKIRGMPGCKTSEVCNASTSAGDAPLGHFSLSIDSISLYNATKIACNDGRAGCD